jgi:hypothetical protein
MVMNSDAVPNCVYNAASQFDGTAQWPFPSQFSQYGKATDNTGNVTMQWRTGTPLVAGQTYEIVRVCSYKAKYPS